MLPIEFFFRRRSAHGANARSFPRSRRSKACIPLQVMPERSTHMDGEAFTAATAVHMYAMVGIGCVAGRSARVDGCGGMAVVDERCALGWGWRVGMRSGQGDV